MDDSMERMIRVIKQKQNTWYITAYGLILLSFFLRVFQLNNIAVEKAEMTNITWYIRDGLGVILTQNRALNNHPLNSVLGYLTSSLGYESLFTLRWHSVVIGVITVAVTFRVARDWFKKQNRLIAGLLISISAYHVTLSQRARSYVSLVGFTLLGFYFGYRAVQTGQKRYWLGFVFVSILNIYAHLYG
ncbi:MAG: glycosyltransferase family 39 protein, partial [Candidatus Odinarchaeota archaeon]